MPKFHAIQLAIDLATRTRDDLAQKHAQAARNLDFAKGQLQQLQGYVGETDQRLLTSGAVSLAPELIRHHYQFMDRLQQAVTMQEGVIANLDRQLDVAHKALLQGEFKLAGLKQVLKQRRAEMQVRENRREQRATDEFAAVRHIHQSAARNTGEHR